MKFPVVTALFCLLLISLWGASASVAAQAGVDELFQRGNEAYSRGDYASAIASYEQLTRQSGYSPGTLFNLANSYALNGEPVITEANIFSLPFFINNFKNLDKMEYGETGKAILNYERALRLKPTDPDIIGNLELVKKESGLFPKESNKTEKFFNLLKLKQWSLLVLCSLILLTLFLFSAIKLRFSRQLTISLSAGCLLLCILALYGTLFHYQYFNPSIVIAPNTRLFISPFDTASSSGIIQQGRRVYPHKVHGDFTYVTDETSRKGWIPSEAIEPVCKTIDQ